MMKKSTILLSFIALFFIPVTLAQPGENERTKKQKIEDLKIAFITRELHLSQEKAQKFWPVYNEMSDKIRFEKKKQKKLAKAMHANEDKYSEVEFKNKSEAYMASGIRESQLKKEYHTKIAAIIGYKKATKLLSLEQRFKRELLNRLNKDQQKPPGDRRPGGPRSEN